MTKFDVELPTALTEWVESRVETGVYADAGDYIRDLVRHDAIERADDLRRLGEIDEAIARSFDDVKEGRVYDADEVFADIYPMIDAAKAKAAAE